MDTRHVQMGPKQQEKLQQLLEGICKERKVTVEADLDTRLSYREKDEKNPKAATWQAYSRVLLSDGHVVYVDLRKMTASVGKNVDKFAQGKAEKKAKRATKAAARKAARLLKEETKAAAKEAKGVDQIIAKVKPVSKAKAKAVVHGAVDEAVKELEAGATAASKKHNARKAKKLPVVKFDPKLPTLEG